MVMTSLCVTVALELTQHLSLSWFLQQSCSVGRTSVLWMMKPTCHVTLNFCNHSVVFLSLQTFCQIVWLHLCVCVYREDTWDSKVNVFHVSKLFRRRKKEFGVSWPEGIWKKTLAKGILANGYTNSWYYGSPTESVLECVNWKKKKHTLKVDNYNLLGGQNWGHKPRR